MKVALVTTPPSIRSGIGDYTRHLLPYLREHCDVELFVDPRSADEPWEGETPQALDELAPRDFDQVLYQLGNERHHDFMARAIRALGGVVMQHDWVLFDLALQAFPGLARGGAKGHALALREGGLSQARVYTQNWLDRRRQRLEPLPALDAGLLAGNLLYGWHDPEERGRWTADEAWLRLPDPDAERVEIELHADAGRTVRVLEGDRVLGESSGGTVELRPNHTDRPLLRLVVDGIRVTKEQRRHGDGRRLGAFVSRVAWKGSSGVQELDLSDAATVPILPVTLSRDRFLLPFNRSIVRFADAFIVHSRYVADRIRAERNSNTAIGLLHHGAEFRWRDEDRREERRRLGLPQAWEKGFLITSFGGVQPHKRIDKALRALADARRERDDIFMVLAGSLHAEGFDPIGYAKGLGLEDAVRFTGFVSEEEGWSWLHAGDVALNLRGPSSGGTSGGIFQAFSMGRSVIASDAAEQHELPDSCVTKIPLGEEEVPRLAQTFVELRDDPARREELERATRRFVEEECHWGVVAKQYADYLESFPKPRVSRRKLIALRVEAQAARK